MRLIRVRVQNYRSIIDSGEFSIEDLKTILVGPNEAGKTVLLQAIQQLNRPDEIKGFDYLRDYPRSLLNDIQTGKIEPKEIPVVTGVFALEESDKKLIPEEFHKCKYELTRNLDNSGFHKLLNGPEKIYFKDVKKDLIRMSVHFDKNFDDEENDTKPSQQLEEIIKEWMDYSILVGEKIIQLKAWLDDNYKYVDEENEKEENRHKELLLHIEFNSTIDKVLKTLGKQTPVFIFFNNYFRVKPIIHLEHLAQRIEQNILDDEYYDYGNLCLLKLLGFDARELADIGSTKSPSINDTEALQVYRDTLDNRSYRLNSASVKLTNEIKSVWMPNPDRPEADKLKVTADGQYLKVVVEDDIGVDIELDQRSAGFQWLVSFFVVFFSEAQDKHENAVLLLDEPGLSLHGLKQRDFRQTISRLADNNQTIYTTHSPFLVGPDELDLVRVVELRDRNVGTKVHTTISSGDPAGLLPLQEALGYDLASSLFSQQRNLVLEGITDYWYLEATAELLSASKQSELNRKIALIFANSAGKVVYYATILHAHNLKVAALLDSDAAGNQAALQDNLVHTLGNKNILRTKDYCDKGISKPEIEDLLRDTLVAIVKEEHGKDVADIIKKHPGRPIIDVFESEISGFSKYHLAKAYIRWTRSNSADRLSKTELKNWTSLIDTINKVLK